MRRVRSSVWASIVLSMGLVIAGPAWSAEKADPKKPDKQPAAQPAKPDAAKQETPKRDTPKEGEKNDVKKTNVVRFTLKEEYPEGPIHEGPFSERKISLATVIERLDQAAGDKNIAAVWLRIEDVMVGRGKVNEIRAAIGRIRKAGKPVYAELASAETPQYLIASACDEVFMPPPGVLVLPGVRAEVTFYKGLLDKLGIEFDVLQMGKYKGAGEPMTRTNMSQPLRESFEAIVDDLYADLASTIAQDRRMKDYQVKTLIDQGIFTAVAAQRAGLVDQVVYADQFEDLLRKKLKAEQIEVLTKYKKKQVDTDFSGLTGFMKLMELLMGGKEKEKAGKDKKVAVVYAVGPIIEGESVTDIFGDGAMGSATLVAALKKAAEDPKVVAIVLRVDSPGGSAVASDLIWRETVRTTKPVIASMSDVAGSGGYYIAMGADKIFAEPGTITGSIGVVGGKVVLKGLFEKIGVNTEVISRGQMSGSFSATQPFTPEERKALTNLMREIYHQFVSKAAQGRKMEVKKLEELAQGRIYTGRMAKANGLVDELGTLQDAVAAAKQAAGLKPGDEVDIQILPKPKTLFEQLFGEPSLATDAQSAVPELFLPLRRAKSLRRLFQDRVLLWMPYEVRVQ